MNQLENIETSVLLRALYSNKEYLLFDIAVCNAGHVTRLHCTDTFKTPCDDGYSFILENTYETEEAIIYVLRERLATITKQWTINCYHYDWVDFLSKYGVSEYNYQRLLKIEKEF